MDSTAIDIKALQKSPSIGVRSSVSDCVQTYADNEFANRLNSKRSTSVRCTPFSLGELQIGTANFASGRLLGEGNLGPVYRAKYADGKVLAVKKINPSFFDEGHPEEFSQIISSISKLHHPNIAELVGYCSEQEHMLIYDYFRNGSLHEFLHLSDDFSKPLTWNTRIRIALGTARAVELHCSRSVSENSITDHLVYYGVDMGSDDPATCRIVMNSNILNTSNRDSRGNIMLSRDPASSLLKLSQEFDDQEDPVNSN